MQGNKRIHIHPQFCELHKLHDGGGRKKKRKKKKKEEEEEEEKKKKGKRERERKKKKLSVCGSKLFLTQWICKLSE
jgi:hypothetical protein